MLTTNYNKELLVLGRKFEHFFWCVSKRFLLFHLKNWDLYLLSLLLLNWNHKFKDVLTKSCFVIDDRLSTVRRQCFRTVMQYDLQSIITNNTSLYEVHRT